MDIPEQTAPKVRIPNRITVKSLWGFEPTILSPYRFNLKQARRLQDWATRLVQYLEQKDNEK